MNAPPTRQLLFPTPGADAPTPRLRVRLHPPALPAWPWQATMITAVNCYLLWGFTWLQFVSTQTQFSFRGQNLWFYYHTVEPWGCSIPELFLGFSLALAVFCITAVTGGTWSTPRLWKRLLAVAIFAAIVIGFSATSLHLRHYCYREAIDWRNQLQREYHRDLVLHYDSEDPYQLQWLEFARHELLRNEREVRRYEEKYQLPPALPRP